MPWLIVGFPLIGEGYFTMPNMTVGLVLGVLVGWFCGRRRVRK